MGLKTRHQCTMIFQHFSSIVQLTRSIYIFFKEYNCATGHGIIQSACVMVHQKGISFPPLSFKILLFFLEGCNVVFCV